MSNEPAIFPNAFVVASDISSRRLVVHRLLGGGGQPAR
jgi:hypothetical protein